MDLNGTYNGPGVTDNGDESFNFDVYAVGPGTYTVDYTYGGGSMSADVTVLPCTDPSCPDCEECDPSDILTVNMNPIPTNTYLAHNIFSNGTVSGTGNVEFMGSISVELMQGFEVQEPGLFLVDLRTCETNVILNPGFENDLDDWQFNLWGSGSGSWNATTSNPWSGSKSMQVITTTPQGTGDSWEVNLRQLNHSIISGKSYTVSFHARADGGNTLRYEVQVNEGSYKEYADRTVELFDHWSKYECSFTADTTSNQLSFMAMFGENVGNYYIDEVKLNETNANQQ